MVEHQSPPGALELPASRGSNLDKPEVGRFGRIG